MVKLTKSNLTTLEIISLGKHKTGNALEQSYKWCCCALYLFNSAGYRFAFGWKILQYILGRIKSNSFEITYYGHIIDDVPPKKICFSLIKITFAIFLPLNNISTDWLSEFWLTFTNRFGASFNHSLSNCPKHKSIRI